MAGLPRRHSLAPLLLFLVLSLGCVRADPKAIYYLVGEADSIGARVYIDGRFQGAMQESDGLSGLDLELDGRPGYRDLRVVNREGKVFVSRVSAEHGEHYPPVGYPK